MRAQLRVRLHGVLRIQEEIYIRLTFKWENISRDKEVGIVKWGLRAGELHRLERKGVKGDTAQNRGPKSKILRNSTKPKASGRTNQAKKELELESRDR